VVLRPASLPIYYDDLLLHTTSTYTYLLHYLYNPSNLIYKNISLQTLFDIIKQASSNPSHKIPPPVILLNFALSFSTLLFTHIVETQVTF
jgi:hypothetical protein